MGSAVRLGASKRTGLAVFRPGELNQRFAFVSLASEGLDQPLGVAEGDSDKTEVFHDHGIVDETTGNAPLAFQQIDQFSG